MKTIGLLGGTAWSSTIGYYSELNQLVNHQLGGYHSAKIILKSIDYHDIMLNYGNNDQVCSLLQNELHGLIELKPDCILICCNSLHKYFDLIQPQLKTHIPVFHAINLTAQYIAKHQYQKVLLLTSKFTLHDGFFAQILRQYKVDAIIPDNDECERLHLIHMELLQNKITPAAKTHFQNLIKSYNSIDAVISGCTEYNMILDESITSLPIIDPVKIQTTAAVNFALNH